MDKITLLRFVGDGTDIGANATALEGEVGGSINESINKAIDVAVQAAVVNTIQEGARKGHWAFLDEKPVVKMPPLPSHIEKPVTISNTEDVPVPKEKKDELVQTQTSNGAKDNVPSTLDKSSDGKDVK